MFQTSKTLYKEIKKTQNQALDVIKSSEKINKKEAIKSFDKRIAYACMLILKEKEIIFFACINFIVVILAYFLFLQVFTFIPDEVWESARKSNNNDSTPADLIITLWAIICIGIAAYPIGIFSACIGAAHFFHTANQESTIKKCINLVMRRVWSIWLLTWIDGYYTVIRMFDRLPGGERTKAEKAQSEMLYYAWKVTTMGVMPALIAGFPITTACKDSLKILYKNPKQMLLLRAGYSAMCWIVGILTYIGTVVFIMYCDCLDKSNLSSAFMNSILFYTAIPILIGVAVVKLILRPLYIIALCDIYTGYLIQEDRSVEVTKNKGGVFSFIAFAILIGLAAYGYIYKDELGITQMLETPYQSRENFR